MNHAAYIFTAWGIAAAVLVLYSVRLVVRGRALTKTVAPAQRRWMSSTDPGSTDPGSPDALRAGGSRGGSSS